MRGALASILDLTTAAPSAKPADATAAATATAATTISASAAPHHQLQRGQESAEAKKRKQVATTADPTSPPHHAWRRQRRSASEKLKAQAEAAKALALEAATTSSMASVSSDASSVDGESPPAPSVVSSSAAHDDLELDPEPSSTDDKDQPKPSPTLVNGRPYRGKCLYQSRKCENERALKRNGKAHNLCEEHRSKQNQHQRKFDAKKFSQRRRKTLLAERQLRGEMHMQYQQLAARASNWFGDHERQVCDDHHHAEPHHHQYSHGYAVYSPAPSPDARHHIEYDPREVRLPYASPSMSIASASPHRHPHAHGHAHPAMLQPPLSVQEQFESMRFAAGPSLRHEPREIDMEHVDIAMPASPYVAMRGYASSSPDHPMHAASPYASPRSHAQVEAEAHAHAQAQAQRQAQAQAEAQARARPSRGFDHRHQLQIQAPTLLRPHMWRSEFRRSSHTPAPAPPSRSSTPTHYESSRSRSIPVAVPVPVAVPIASDSQSQSQGSYTLPSLKIAAPLKGKHFLHPLEYEGRNGMAPSKMFSFASLKSSYGLGSSSSSSSGPSLSTASGKLPIQHSKLPALALAPPTSHGTGGGHPPVYPQPAPRQSNQQASSGYGTYMATIGIIPSVSRPAKRFGYGRLDSANEQTGGRMSISDD